HLRLLRLDHDQLPVRRIDGEEIDLAGVRKPPLLMEEEKVVAESHSVLERASDLRNDEPLYGRVTCHRGDLRAVLASRSLDSRRVGAQTRDATRVAPHSHHGGEGGVETHDREPAFGRT